MNKHKFVYGALVLSAALVSYALLMQNARIFSAPHTAIVSLLYDCRFSYDPAIGYVSPDAGIAITPNCMGATLFVAAFLLLSFGFPPESRRPLKLAVYYAMSLVGALGVSVLRIALSLPFVTHASAQLIHNLISLAVYFIALLALYLCMQRRST